jgi:hypothetical protein
MARRRFPVRHSHPTPALPPSMQALLVRGTTYFGTRLDTCCEAIAVIGSLARSWPPGRDPSFTIQAAAIQDSTAGRQGFQAAHLLPGQLLIDERAPWHWAASDPEKVRLLARFAVTAAVPTELNVADSAVEEHGLGDAFRDACRDLFLAVRAGRGGAAALREVYATFLDRAEDAVVAALWAKNAKVDEHERRGKDAKADDRAAEAALLKAYLHHGVTADYVTLMYEDLLGE